MYWDIYGLGGDWGERRNPLKKMFLSENVIFRGHRFSFGRLVIKTLKALCLSFKWGINILSTSFHCGLIDI